MSAGPPMLTVLICTHNRAELLARVLDSLQAADRPKDWRVRILVMANACSDATHEVLESEHLAGRRDVSRLPLDWLEEPTPGKSHALNTAIPHLMESDLVAFVDDDHRVDAGYLRQICAAAEEYTEATLFCGRILPDWDGSEPAWVHDDGPYRIYPLPVPRQDFGATPRPLNLKSDPVPGGGNLFLRPGLFARVGGFSTDLGPKGHDLGGGEDGAFVLAAVEAGERLQYVPGVLQYHYVDHERLRLPYLLRKAFQRSRAASRLHHAGRKAPLYMWRKLAGYALRLPLPLGWSHLRFYLMRIASTLGEIQGHAYVKTDRPIICFITGSSGDWGGASRVLYTNLRLLDRSRLEPLLLLPRDGPILPELRQRGLRHVVWGPLAEPGNIPNYVRTFFRALHFFRRERVSAIHVNHSNFWRPAELLAAWILRIPIVAHYHVINDAPGPFMKLCDAAISVSHYTADMSLPADLDKPVIYNPISLERFDGGSSMRAELGLAEDDVVVSFLGQIREIKGVEDFIAMARRVPEPRARFLIAGECRDPLKYPGSYSPDDLKRLAEGDTRIRYIGYVKAVENVYHTSDIVVVPSRWHEPLGLINLEASACSKPVIATRVGGIPEVVRDGINGYLVEKGDVADLVRRVEELIADPDTRRRMGEAGRMMVEDHFSVSLVREFETVLLKYAKGTRVS